MRKIHLVLWTLAILTYGHFDAFSTILSFEVFKAGLSPYWWEHSTVIRYLIIGSPDGGLLIPGLRQELSSAILFGALKAGVISLAVGLSLACERYEVPIVPTGVPVVMLLMGIQLTVNNVQQLLFVF